FFLAPERYEAMAAATTAVAFPTGVELPHEVSSVFPHVYNDWVARQIKDAKGSGLVRRFIGPVNRCDLCYEQPPAAESLAAAGVFWASNAPSAPTETLRGRSHASKHAAATPGLQGYDTWLTRHLFAKKPKATLTMALIE